MITDKIKNIDKYKDIPKMAKEFIKNLSPDILTGKVILSENIYANVEEYNTKPLSNGKFESHDKYIDIQLLLKGKEKIYLQDRQNLTVSEPYNKEKDITFYKDKLDNSFSLLLDGSNFAMLYPHEAHAPQIAPENEPLKVKKVVVKIKI